MMRQLSFRPFRRVGDRLVVTAYTGWRKIYTANYEGAIVRLLPFPVIKPGELIHNNRKDITYGNQERFEPLYWPVPDAIYRPIVDGVRQPLEPLINSEFLVSPFDCDGCPTFSHKNADTVADYKMDSYELLTAETVYHEFEIMRDTLTKITWTK